MRTKILQKSNGKAKFTLNRRTDGRLEVVCEHQIGHTISAPEKIGKLGFLHGCDGCCGTDAFKIYAEEVKAKRKLV